MKKLIKIASTVAAAAAIAVAGEGVSNAAQGGVTGVPPHAWFKVARSELVNWNTQAACTSTGVSRWNCAPLAAAVDRERARNPRANGYWSEFFVNGSTRSGTW
ncbi:hypothetical protein HH308_11170 [Gordonia sp. TBRC 11910]|uniref:Uncharacterized protein n=1 Tax=Gordonia asplenii TaxID=2725283 RepID=A0A848KS36_9ACTN|nr:hypothetical protein [Gordonia asplenii]NMO01774.1 hypothetical protein [Gordonia asplenii]